MTKNEIEERAKETTLFEMNGIKAEIPLYSDCKKCGAKLACRHYAGVGYMQPCDDCKKKPEYYQEYKDSLAEKAKLERMAYATENKQLGGIFESNDGKYEILVSKKGNVMRQEKKRPRQLGKVEKKKDYLLPK